MPRTSADAPIERVPSDDPVVPERAPVTFSRKGRGAVSNVAHRFESVDRTTDACEPGDDEDERLAPLATTVTLETARSIITRNDSPDIGFDRSINPYRGCEHVMWNSQLGGRPTATSTCRPGSISRRSSSRSATPPRCS